MAEPLTVAEAKSHLRVNHSSEDTYIGSLVSAARLDLEAETWRSIVRGSRTLVLDRFPCGSDPIYLPRPPLVSVQSITFIDAWGSSQTLTGFQVEATHEPGKIVPAANASWPQTYPHPAAVIIEFTAGHADGNVPENIRQAMRLKISEFYEGRTPSVQERRTTLDRMLEKIRFRDLRISRFMTGEVEDARLGL